MVNKPIKSFFSFTKKELNGLLIFCSLLVIIVYLPSIVSLFADKEEFKFKEFKDEIAAFRASQNEGSRESFLQVKDEIEDKELAPEYFEFNPNGLKASEWRRLGLSEKQIKVIKNYESKGGKFYRKEDLKKIYSVSEVDYARLEPFIRIPEKRTLHDSKKTSSFSPPAQRKKLIIELNSADSITLEHLPGIGPTFASRILKYRTRLGGFYNKEQLKEVYGLDSVKYRDLENRVEIDPTHIAKININTASFEDLKRHPYLSYKQMNAIIKFRNQHGKYNNINDLRKVAIINGDILRKIEPYLNFND